MLTSYSHLDNVSNVLSKRGMNARLIKLYEELVEGIAVVVMLGIIEQLVKVLGAMSHRLLGRLQILARN